MGHHNVSFSVPLSSVPWRVRILVTQYRPVADWVSLRVNLIMRVNLIARNATPDSNPPLDWAPPAHETLPSLLWSLFVRHPESSSRPMQPSKLGYFQSFCSNLSHKIKVWFWPIQPLNQMSSKSYKSNAGSTRTPNVSQNVFLFGGELSGDTENLVLIYQRAATKFVKIFPLPGID